LWAAFHSLGGTRLFGGKVFFVFFGRGGYQRVFWRQGEVRGFSRGITFGPGNQKARKKFRGIPLFSPLWAGSVPWGAPLGFPRKAFLGNSTRVQNSARAGSNTSWSTGEKTKTLVLDGFPNKKKRGGRGLGQRGKKKKHTVQICRGHGPKLGGGRRINAQEQKQTYFTPGTSIGGGARFSFTPTKTGAPST